MYKRIVVGIDQSYEETGVSICADGKLVKLSSITFENKWSNTRKRREVNKRLNALLSKLTDRAKSVEVNIERVRLNSDGFVNINPIKSIGALNAVIVDTAEPYGVNVYSVDTRAWKSQIVGTSKPKLNSHGIDPKKWPTIEWLIKHGYEEHLKKVVTAQKKKGVFIGSDGIRFTYNDNIADSACIALYGFRGDREKLELEH